MMILMTVMMTKPYDFNNGTDDDNDHKNYSCNTAGAAPGASVPYSLFLVLCSLFLFLRSLFFVVYSSFLASCSSFWCLCGDLPNAIPQKSATVRLHDGVT